MRRREVSDEELNQVIRLKQAGASWLKIQEKTRVPRRTARRAYEDWQRDQSVEELKAARVTVAAEEFREHLTSLIKLAGYLADYLDLPQSPSTTMSAQQFLDNLWGRDILGEPEPWQWAQDGGRRERRRMVRQYEMLLKSLQEHTREKVRWELLDEWCQAWDNCIKSLDQLREEAPKMIRNIMNQKPGLVGRIVEGSREKDAVQRMVEAVLDGVWQSVLDDKPELEHALVRVRTEGDGSAQVTLVELSDRVVLKLGQQSLAEEAADACNRAAKDLREGDKKHIVESSRNDVRTMKKAIEELAQMLNPLILRPLILRTRCELCPA